jgi:Ca-activated chloride channel family protein
MLPAEFHFLRPWWLLALLPLAGLLLIYMRRRLHGGGWQRVCDAALLPHVLIGTATEAASKRPLVLLALAGALTIVALAGPAWDRLPQPVFNNRDAMVIALDLSRSMDATDLHPSRLTRARFKVNDMLRERRDGLTALLAYAGEAFTVTPLTDDTATILSQLSALTTDIMPVLGNDTAAALDLAGKLLRQAGLARGNVVLITDEVDAGAALPIARQLRSSGYRVSVLGVGTEDGAPVVLPDGGFLKDDAGEIVIPRLDEEPMRELAQAGGGAFSPLTVDDSDLRQLTALNETWIDDSAPEESRRIADVWEDRGPWLLLPLLPLAALAFRRGALLAVLLLVALPLPRPVSALEWQELWQRSDQIAKQRLDAGDARGAAQLFEQPEWKSAAQYRAGEFDAAAKSIEPLKTPDANYNRGNALARQGKFEDAIAAYDATLDVDPDHEDAAFNRKLVEEALKQQQQQQQPSGGQDQQQSGQQQQSDRQQPQSGRQQQQQDGEQPRDQQAQAGESGPSGQQSADESPSGASQSPQTGGDGEPDRQSAEQGTAQQDAQAGQQDGTNLQPSRMAVGEQGETGDQPVSAADRKPYDEQQAATEQWLRRIPDDPSGLLRRKFEYQYRQRGGRVVEGDKSW